MKIKVFKFEVTNFTTTYNAEDRRKANQYQIDAMNRIYEPEEIEDIINDAIKGLNVVDIKVNVLHTDYHNNGRSNTMHMVYTIMYQ